MNHKAILLGTAAIVAAAIGAVAMPVYAAAAADTSASNTNMIEEVLVTARKREENLQDVPVAVTAASGEQLQKQGLREVNDLARLSPSLQIGSTPGGGANSAFIVMRGQRAADLLLTVSQPVGIYVDGVNVPHPVGANSSFFDLERVEVLKGPQGTLYGRNTTGGAINFITRGPDNDGIHGFAEADLSNYNGYRISGAVNVPLMGDKLTGRLAAQYWKRDGYVDAPLTGQKLGGDQDDLVVRGTLNYDPTDNFQAILKYEYTDTKKAGLPYTILYRTALAPLLAVPEASAFAGSPAGLNALIACTNASLFQSCAGLHQRDDVKTQHAVLNMNWQPAEWLSIRSITGYHYFKNFRVFDLDGSPYAFGENGYGLGGVQPNVGIATIPTGALLPNGTAPSAGPFVIPVPLRPDQESGQFTQEFNFSGTVSIVDWMVGAFYSNDDGNGVQVTVRNPASAIRTAPYYAPTATAFDGLDVSTKTAALFTQNDIKFSERISLTLGARYTKEDLSQKISAWAYNQNFQTAAAPNISGPGRNFQCTFGPFAASTIVDQFGGVRPNTFQTNLEACAVNQKASSDGTSYLASLNVKPTSDTLFYAKISKGFRGGALQLRAPYVAPVEPETAKEYEAGFKGDFFEHRLRTNIAVYRTDYTNQQQTGIEFVPGTATRTTVLRNASSARYQGFELEARVIPLDGLSVYGNVGYLDAKYRTWTNAPVALGNPAPATIDASGMRIELPKWTGNLGARYEHDLAGGKLGLQADLNFYTKTPLTALTNEAAVPDSWEQWVRKGRQLLSARIDYAIPDRGLTVAIWATNLTDEHYQTANIVSTANGGLFEGVTRDPRMYGITIRKTFGNE